MPLPEPTDRELAEALALVRATVRQSLPTRQDRGAAAEEMRQALAEAAATSRVVYLWPLSASGLWEEPVVLFNRVVRRYLHWYLGQIVAQQNASNDAVARTLELLAQNMHEIDARQG